MNFEEGLEVANESIFNKVGRWLNDAEIAILQGSWLGKTYEEIAKETSYSVSYLKRGIGPKLWKMLTEALGESVSKTNFKSAIERRWRRQSRDDQTWGRGDAGTSTEGESPIQNHATSLNGGNQSTRVAAKLGSIGSVARQSKIQNQADWGEAIDVSAFYGRTQELATLEKWIVSDRCRLITILGMGGMGKTALAVKLAQQIQPEFEYVIWRSLRNAPIVDEILAELLQLLWEDPPTLLPQTIDGRILRLMESLRSYRCLLILDNAESILQSNDARGNYREGYEGYGHLLRCVAETPHQSCLVLTSREKPKGLAAKEGETLPIRSLQLTGLHLAEARKIFLLKGTFTGSKSEWESVITHYGGNPLALKILATGILEFFEGSLSIFVKFCRQETLVFDDIRDLLERQFNRLTEIEKSIMYWICINRESVSFEELQEDFIMPQLRSELLEALRSLQKRSLVEKIATGFIQQPVVMEYVTEHFIELCCQEIAQEEARLLGSHALIKATAKDYIRESQIRLILKPILEQLHMTFQSEKILEDKFNRILVKIREKSPLELGYTAGNVVNLLRHLKTDLSGHDFSYLTVWQADLRSVNLHNANFQNANLSKSAFIGTFGAILSVTFSHDGNLLATGDTNGEIHLYQVANGQQLLTCKGHKGWVWSVSFSPDGKILASGSEDQTVKLWDTSNGHCLKNLALHSSTVFSVAFSPDGHTLASSSEDHTVKLWNVSTGQLLKNLLGHTNWVFSVAFSPIPPTPQSSGGEAGILASGSNDHTVKLWDTSTGQCLKTLHGHTQRVLSVAFSPNSDILVSGSDDHTAKLWDTSTGQCLKTLQGHSSGLWSVAFSPDGQTIASSSNDQTVRLWDCVTQRCFKILGEHNNRVLSVVFSPNGHILASGTFDQEIRFWDAKTGQCLKTLQGYANWVFSVAFSPNGRTLASGSNDCKVRLWEISKSQCFKTLQGHSNKVWSVTFSPDGSTLASSGDDQTVKLWDIRTGQCLNTLLGHIKGVLSIAFSPSGKVIASGGEDQTVKLWDIRTGQCLNTLFGHTNRIYSVAFSPDASILASGSEDKTLKLWHVNTGQCLKTLQGHTGWVRSVVFSPDCQLLASSSDDKTVKLWHVGTGQCLKTLQGHTDWVWSVTFSPKGDMVASGSHDESVKLWDVLKGDCVQTLKDKRPYEGMNITGVTGTNQVTIETLKALGAVEY